VITCDTHYTAIVLGHMWALVLQANVIG